MNTVIKLPWIDDDDGWKKFINNVKVCALPTC